jgi:hypothetical protein
VAAQALLTKSRTGQDREAPRSKIEFLECPRKPGRFITSDMLIPLCQ